MNTLGTLGDVLGAVENEIATVPEVQAKPAKKRALISLEMYAPVEYQDTRFMDTSDHLHGHLIVSPVPGDTKTTPYALRWGLTRSRLETVEGATAIVREPMIRPADRIVFVCTSCKHVGKEWRDRFMGRYMDGMRGVAIEGFKFRCPKCRTGTAVAAVGIPTITQMSALNHDNVTKMDSQVLKRLKAAYAQGDDGQDAVLPKIWAVYDKGAAPAVNWTPADEADQAVIEAAAGYREKRTGDVRPMVVLPYNLAAPYHMPGRPVSRLAALWIDTKPVLGYVNQEELQGSGSTYRNLGWKRSFLARDWREGRLDGKVSH